MTLYQKEVELLHTLMPVLISRDQAFQVFKSGFVCHGVDLNQALPFANAMIFTTGYGMSDHAERVANLYIKRMGLPLKAEAVDSKTKCSLIVQYLPQ